ncbi:hypothetical protein F0A16_02795 [Salinicola corii]|uniref:Uncharacterized protein n=1 Tax=Salinicola corii TaxID=2606937 RepID=A0A640WJB5_9GAMM|nr:hypothetical protein [Salinicola corii]KAA0020733.1 hypothetical protein F0A16_02795 [Salinicola corii]
MGTSQKIAEDIGCGLTAQDVDEVDIEELLQEDTGSSGEMVYSLYFNVPENTPAHILAKTGWEIGDRVEVSQHVFDSPDD